LVQKGLPGGESLSYEYDAANRLVKGAGIPYEYDAANNITKKSTVTYTYDKAGQIATASNATFEFNKLGQRIKRDPTGEAATTYAYDQAGNLISVQRLVEGEAAKIDETYKSDGTGLRVSESVEGVAHPMVWDVSSGLPLLLTNGSTKWIYGPEGFPVEQINPSEEVRFLHHDQQGSTRLITNAAGNVVGAYHYGPYGTIETFTGTVTTPLGFGGQYRSSQSGLIYLRARVYDLITGQFLTVDPIVGLTGEPYSYAADNPVNATDPTGLCVGDPVCPKCPSVRPDATNTRMTSPPRERLPVPPNTNTIGPNYVTRLPLSVQLAMQRRDTKLGAIGRVLGAGLQGGVTGFADGQALNPEGGGLVGALWGASMSAGWQTAAELANETGHPYFGTAISAISMGSNVRSAYKSGPTIMKQMTEIGSSMTPSTYIPPSHIPAPYNGSLYIP
jgi:RHS repeat-associated protein